MPSNESENGLVTLEIRLRPDDFAILQQYRGDLSVDSFFSLLLRMVDSGAVSIAPDLEQPDDEQSSAE